MGNASTSSPSSGFRWIAWLAVAGMSVPILLACAGTLFPWSEINCWHEDIDLSSGRVRTTWYLCFVPVSVRIEETSLSRSVEPDAAALAQPDWKRVNTFSLGVNHSPHYQFHGAITEASMFEDIWEAGRFTPEARRESARQILKMWKRGGTLRAAEDYLNTISEIGLKNHEANRETTASELPNDASE